MNVFKDMIESFTDLMTDSVKYYSIGETNTSTGIVKSETLEGTIKGVIWSKSNRPTIIGDKLQADADFIAVHKISDFTFTLKDSFRAELNDNGLLFKVIYIDDVAFQGAGKLVYLKEDRRSG